MNAIGPRRGRHTIFFKVLTGYLSVTLLTVLLTGVVSYVLVHNYVTEFNREDLLDKAETMADMLNNGKKSFLTVGMLRRLEDISDSQMVYVDANMVAQQIPTRARRPKDKTAPPAATPGPSPTPAADGEADAPAPNPALPAFPGAYAGSLSGYGDERRPPFVPDVWLSDADAQEDEALQRIDIAGSVDEALIKSILAGAKATDVRALQFTDNPVMFAGAPVVNSETGEITGAIILCRTLTDIGTTTRAMILRLALAGVLALVGAALLALYMSRRLTKPVSRLCETAGRMVEGEYGARSDVIADDEIGRLSETLNLLSARLSTVIGTLSDEKSKLEKILSAIGEGIVAIDRDDRIIHHNAAALGLLELKNWEELSDDEHALSHRQKLIEMLNNAMATGERTTVNWVSPGGRAIESIASPVIGTEGGIIGAVCLIRDVSEAQRLEQMRRDYIANISHELRTPLTGIRGMVEPLLDGLMETEQEKNDCYQVIYQETIRLEKLIGEMLDLSRLQDGRIQLELEPMEPDGLLEAAVRRMRDRAQEGGVTLSCELQESGMALMGSEDRILQVLIILTDNALSFTPPGGSVTLFARRAGDKVALGVRDTGCGIDPKDLPYIWERFYKADRSRMRTTGTGLGLAIAKLVVELMGGEIWAETQPGEGSTFTFTLAAL